MSDNDLLTQATRAMRQEVVGKNNGSGFTRARIMRSLQKTRKRSALAWVVIPTLGLALGGTAWASATGRLPVVVQRVVALLSIPVEVPEPKPPQAQSPKPAKAVSPRGLPLPRVEKGTAEQASSPDEALRVDTVASAAPAPPVPKRKDNRRTQESARRAQAQPPGPVPDAELSAFRSAHSAQFGGASPAAAVEEYRRYLTVYPDGRFVPEARFNIALNLVRLGHWTQARDALSPFAAGAYGEYRRREAESLLRAIEAPPATLDAPSASTAVPKTESAAAEAGD